MAKVGTSSISHNLNIPYKHKHFLSAKSFSANISNYSKVSTTGKSVDIIKTFNPIFGLLFRIKKRRIITMFRDPYSRNTSSMFQFLVGLLQHHNPAGIENKQKNTSELLDYYFSNHVRHDLPFKWFDEEFKEATKIDIFEYPFDKEKGYIIIKKGKFEVLLITLEKLNDNEQTIRDFIDDQSFVLTHKNDGSKKWYSDLYANFKERHFLNEEELRFYYDNDVVRHFYMDEQIEQFKLKWSKKVD